MGYEWLSKAVAALEAAGFAVEQGYPGRRAAMLTGTAVAVDLSGLDLGAGTASITAAVLVPRAAGLAQCQQEAARAAQTLSALGGKWSYSGWRFDSHLDGYCVEVRGVVAAGTESVYAVSIDGVAQHYVTDLLARQQQDRAFVRPHGSSAPSSVTPGMGGWKLRMTQLLPADAAEPGLTADGFSLGVVRGNETVTYLGCCWDEYSSQQTALGVRVIRTGYALSREVSSDG